MPVKDAALVERIEGLQSRIGQSKADVKFVEKGNFHYNFKFFGSRTEAEINRIEAATERALAKRKKFDIEIAGLGTFPTADFIRVVWLGLKKGEKEMLSMAQELEDAFAAIGIDREERPFQAHLTLGRLRSTENLDALKRKVSEEKDAVIGSMLVDEVILYQSMLSRNGPTYVELKRFGLK